MNDLYGLMLLNPLTLPFMVGFAIAETGAMLAAGTAMAVGQAVLMPGTLGVVRRRDLGRVDGPSSF